MKKWRDVGCLGGIAMAALGFTFVYIWAFGDSNPRLRGFRGGLVNVLIGIGSYGFWVIALVGLPLLAVYAKRGRPLARDIAFALSIIPVFAFGAAHWVVWKAGVWPGDPSLIVTAAFVLVSIVWWIRTRRKHSMTDAGPPT